MRYEWQYGPAIVAQQADLTNVVTAINWMVLGYDNSDNVYKDSGVAPAPAPNPNTFLPFDQITESEVQGWVFMTVNRNEVQDKLYQQSIAVPDTKPFNF
jgi:hypothetical protein